MSTCTAWNTTSKPTKHVDRMKNTMWMAALTAQSKTIINANIARRESGSVILAT